MRKLQEAEKIDSFDIAEPVEEEQGERLIKGRRARFSNDGAWITDDEEEIPGDLELVVVERAAVLQKWKDQQPIETRWLAPGEKVDVAALNASCPKEEWREGLSGPVGPWQRQALLYLLDPQTADKITYVTSTVGGNLAIGDLSDRIRTMRQLRGGGLFPVVVLSDTFMRTRFGGRQRPHFKVMRWVRFGGEGAAALPAPQTPLITGQTVEEPTLKEEIGNEIKF